jgi:hypothetical protein
MKLSIYNIFTMLFYHKAIYLRNSTVHFCENLFLGLKVAQRNIELISYSGPSPSYSPKKKLEWQHLLLFL